MTFLKQLVACVLCFALLVSTFASAAGPQESSQQGEQAQDANLTPSELDDLVSPIALYPDALVAQILAAATFPDQITAANEWLGANSKLKDQALMEAVDKQDWDPSVKALTQFPSVLENMSKNLSWASALGEASFYQQKDVMAAVQRLRKKAKAAGNLKSGEQIKVVQQDPQTIVIQPANPQVVYVPQYNPTVVYGTPQNPPGYSGADLALTGIISFGVGMAIGAAIRDDHCCGWGWHRGGWGCGWRGGTVVYQRNVYVSRSRVYAGRPRPARYRRNIGSGNRQTNIGNININTGNRTNINSGNRPGTNRPPASARPAPKISSREAWRKSTDNRAKGADRGFGQRPAPSTKSGAFSGYNKGGSARAESARGRTSLRNESRAAPRPSKSPRQPKSPRRR